MILLILCAAGCGVCMLLAAHSPFWTVPGILLLMLMTVRSLQWLRQSRRDPLTGLNNLRHLDAMERRYRRWDCLTVCYFDLDNLKQVNDSRGHDSGDRLLQEMAAQLQGIAGESGAAYRIGGDEFLLILRGQIAEHTLEQLCVQATWGTATGTGSQLQQLIREADRNLYQKRNTL